MRVCMMSIHEIVLPFIMYINFLSASNNSQRLILESYRKDIIMSVLYSDDYVWQSLISLLLFDKFIFYLIASLLCFFVVKFTYLPCFEFSSHFSWFHTDWLCVHSVCVWFGHILFRFMVLMVLNTMKYIYACIFQRKMISMVLNSWNTCMHNQLK